MRKIIAAIVATVYSLMLTVAPVLAQTSGVTGTVTVATVCGVDSSSGSITFDGTGPGNSVNPGSDSFEDVDDELLTLTNTGNADTTSFTIEGTGWTEFNNPSNTMLVGATSYDPDGLQSFSGTALALTPGATIYGGVLADNDSNDMLFRVTISDSDQPADTYNQDITFTFGCDQG